MWVYGLLYDQGCHNHESYERWSEKCRKSERRTVELYTDVTNPAAVIGFVLRFDSVFLFLSICATIFNHSILQINLKLTRLSIFIGIFIAQRNAISQVREPTRLLHTRVLSSPITEIVLRLERTFSRMPPSKHPEVR